MNLTVHVDRNRPSKKLGDGKGCEGLGRLGGQVLVTILRGHHVRVGEHEVAEFGQRGPSSSPGAGRDRLLLPASFLFAGHHHDLLADGDSPLFSYLRLGLRVLLA